MEPGKLRESRVPSADDLAACFDDLFLAVSYDGGVIPLGAKIASGHLGGLFDSQ